MDHIQASPAASIPPPVSELQTPPPTPKSKLQSRLFMIIALLATLLMSSLAVFYVLSAQQNSSAPSPTPVTQPSPSPTPDPTANWKVYRDIKHDYEFRYPSNRTVCSSQIQGFPYSTDVRFDKECDISEPGQIIIIQVSDAPQPELTSPYPNCYTYTKSQITIAQMNGFKYTPVVKNGVGECTMTSYRLTDTIEFDSNNKHFSIRTYNDEDKNADQILSTFKFTDQTTSPSTQNTKNLPEEQCGCWDGINNTCLSQSACL